jgi:hypothetical protein
MKTSRAFIVALAAFVMGGMGGFMIEHHRLVTTVSHLQASVIYEDAASAYSDLCNLRKGDTNALFDRMEGDVTSGAVFLTPIIEKNPQTLDASMYHSFLLDVVDYRAKYPWHTHDTNWDNKVTAALAKITKY